MIQIFTPPGTAGGKPWTPPPPRWQHQDQDLDNSALLPNAAIHWEPRCGKSRLAVETAARLRGERKIDAVVVLAPAGIHLDWAEEHIPSYYGPWAGAPEDQPYAVLAWQASKAGTKKYQAALEHLRTFKGLIFFTANIESLQPRSRLMKYLPQLLKIRTVLLVVDESHQIKNPKANRTKQLIPLADKCRYTRCLTGTPAVQGPFDLWAQYRLLSPRILGPRFTSFKARYAEFKKNRPVLCDDCGTLDRYRIIYGKKRIIQCLACGSRSPVNRPLFDELVSYRNLEELRARIQPHTFVRRKADCFDLPDRIETVRRFEMPDAHARVYQDLVNEARAILASGQTISASIALKKLLRLQQAARGHTMTDDGEALELGGPYPAAMAAADLVQENGYTGGKSIVWARFKADLDRIEEQLRDQAPEIEIYRCDGSVPQEERPDLRARFKETENPAAWIGTTSTGGIGVDLGSANLMIFYSHGFSLGERLQALERNYGSSQKAQRVDVVDLVAAGSVDRRALEILKKKAALADMVAADAPTDNPAELFATLVEGDQE